jgi:hypothetical protein
MPPLKAPAIAPVSKAATMEISTPAPDCTATPKMTLQRARVLATERSISRAMMRSDIGKTINARSETPAIA